jgi:hypothetical protein
MTRLALASIVLITGCAARAGFGVGGPSRGGAATPPPPPPPANDVGYVGGSYSPGEDAHWFQLDDYLVSPKPYERKKLALHVAKLTTAATPESKSEARFLLANGEELWTATYFRTRIANQSDLRVGALAMCHAGYWSREGEAPKDKHHARDDEWIVAAITDTADLYKGRVTVGNTSCAVGAVRVPVQ